MSDRKSVTISADSVKFVEKYTKNLQDEVEFRDAVDRLIGSGFKRLEALRKYSKKEKREDGTVKGKRETAGGNMKGWQKRKARRDASAAAKGSKKPRAKKPAASKSEAAAAE